MAPEGNPRAPTHTLKVRALRGVKAHNLLLFFTRATEDGDGFCCRRLTSCSTHLSRLDYIRLLLQGKAEMHGVTLELVQAID